MILFFCFTECSHRRRYETRNVFYFQLHNLILPRIVLCFMEVTDATETKMWDHPKREREIMEMKSSTSSSWVAKKCTKKWKAKKKNKKNYFSSFYIFDILSIFIRIEKKLWKVSTFSFVFILNSCWWDWK